MKLTSFLIASILSSLVVATPIASPNDDLEARGKQYEASMRPPKPPTAAQLGLNKKREAQRMNNDMRPPKAREASPFGAMSPDMRPPKAREAEAEPGTAHYEQSMRPPKPPTAAELGLNKKRKAEPEPVAMRPPMPPQDLNRKREAEAEAGTAHYEQSMRPPKPPTAAQLGLNKRDDEEEPCDDPEKRDLPLERRQGTATSALYPNFTPDPNLIPPIPTPLGTPNMPINRHRRNAMSTVKSTDDLIVSHI